MNQALIRSPYLQKTLDVKMVQLINKATTLMDKTLNELNTVDTIVDKTCLYNC